MVSSQSALAWTCALLVALLPGCLDWDKYQHGRCGDGFQGPEESCDDRNTASGDGCSEDCQVEPPRCGNGRTEAGEACDDRNTASGDGCSASCEVEPSKCGNGRMESGEECDDHNTASGDGCSATCKEEPEPGPACGDGNLDDDEVCDDGNTSNSDACLKGCSRATCGDGFVRAHVEECDVSSTQEGKVCTPACLACDAEPDGYYRGASRHCFTRHLEASTQAEARATCQREGGDLWTITTLDEGQVAIGRMKLKGLHWLGLIAKAGDTHWVTGETLELQNFAVGEPGITPPGCVSVLADGVDNAWQGSPCDEKLPFVCERGAPFVDFATNHAYTLHSDVAAVEAARARCKDEGGVLATIETEAERVFLSPKLTLKVWLDASEIEDGQFEWSTGIAVDPALFRPGQPDGPDGSQDCLLLEPKRRLADEPCTQAHAYLCEHE